MSEFWPTFPGYEGASMAADEERIKHDMYCPLAGGSQGVNNFSSKSCEVKKRDRRIQTCFNGCNGERERKKAEANKIKGHKAAKGELEPLNDLENKIVKLRKSGKTYKQVREQLGINQSIAINAVTKARKRGIIK